MVGVHWKLCLPRTVLFPACCKETELAVGYADEGERELPRPLRGVPVDDGCVGGQCGPDTTDNFEKLKAVRAASIAGVGAQAHVQAATAFNG